MEKKIVLETKVKIVDDNIEKIIDESQFVQEVTNTVETHSLIIAAGSSFEFSPSGAGVKGAKGIRITSDIPVKLSHSHTMNNYNTGFYGRDITLFGGTDPNVDEHTEIDQTTLGYLGSITINNRDTQKDANVRIIYYF